MSDNPHIVAHDTSTMSDLENGKANEVPSIPPLTSGNQEKETNQEETGQDSQHPRIDDWNGPDDPANPHNWPMWIRAYHSAVPGLFGFAVTFGTSVYTPSVFDLMDTFHISRTLAIVGLTVYTLGLGFGPIFSAPLSETHGRKIVYMSSSPLFMLFTLGAALSKSMGPLLVCRFFAGVTGSPALAVGAGTTADLFPPQMRAMATSLFLMAPFAGPALGPVVGGYASQYKGWQWTQWSLLILSGVVFLISLPMKETYKPEILKRRAKKLGLAPHMHHANAALSAKRTIVQNFVRPMHMLITEPVVFFFSLYTAFAFAILFLLFAAFPLVFQRPPYNLSISHSGLLFLSIGIGVLLGGATGIFLDRYLYQPHARQALRDGKAHAAPEHRLYTAMVGSVGIPIGLFWFAWTADRGLHWAIPVAAAVPFAWGNLCVFISSILYMADVYGPTYGASAVAANGFFRYTLGGVFPLFTVQMYTSLGIGWATSLLGFLSVLMLPIPWVFYKWGPAIRKGTGYQAVY